MKKVCLFIAMSLDGYIADRFGHVDWLKGQDQGAEEIDSYSEFVQNIDTVIMGWKTYDQIVTELSPDEWIYEPFTTYVITHRDKKSTDRIRFISMNPVQLVDFLRKEDGKDIWICGGARLVNSLIENDRIDLYCITIIPTLLGSGIRLFDRMEHPEIKLRLKWIRSNNGMTELVYVRRETGREKK